MKIEANVEQIRALLQFAAACEHDEGRDHASVPRGLPANLVARCYSLLDAGRRPAVVALEKGICAGCHLRLPTAIESGTRRTLALHTCPSCHRLLYVPELLAKPQAKQDVPDVARASAR